jgi:hypothetical protein
MKPMRRKRLESILSRKGCIWTCGKCTVAVPRHVEITAGVMRTIVNNLTPCLGKGWLTR